MKNMTKLSRQEVDEVIASINDMEPDQIDRVVDHIRAIYKAKRALANAQAKANLKVGSRVKLTGNYKPQYLRGLTGEVIEMKNTRVVVLLEEGPVGKFRTGKVVATPAGLTVMN